VTWRKEKKNSTATPSDGERGKKKKRKLDVLEHFQRHREMLCIHFRNLLWKGRGRKRCGRLEWEKGGGGVEKLFDGIKK